MTITAGRRNSQMNGLTIQASKAAMGRNTSPRSLGSFHSPLRHSSSRRTGVNKKTPRARAFATPSLKPLVVAAQISWYHQPPITPAKTPAGSRSALRKPKAKTPSTPPTNAPSRLRWEMVLSFITDSFSVKNERNLAGRNYNAHLQ